VSDVLFPLWPGRKEDVRLARARFEGLSGAEARSLQKGASFHQSPGPRYQSEQRVGPSYVEDGSRHQLVTIVDHLRRACNTLIFIRI
jgi:hypothetical protein